MGRKYLEGIGVTPTNQITDNSDDEREERWAKDTKVFGFDDRDTWNLDSTMLELLYERVRMYVEVSEIVNHEATTLIVDGVKRPLSWVIDEILRLSKEALTFDQTIPDEGFETLEEYEQAERRLLDTQKKVWSLWAQSFYCFWW